MKPFPVTADLVEVAARVVWFETPEKALADPVRFLAHVMTYGTPDDLEVVRRHAGDDDFREALELAPPGIMDARSWAYWNVMAGKDEVPPMPVRRFPT